MLRRIATPIPVVILASNLIWPKKGEADWFSQAFRTALSAAGRLSTSKFILVVILLGYITVSAASVVIVGHHDVTASDPRSPRP